MVLKAAKLQPLQPGLGCEGCLVFTGCGFGDRSNLERVQRIKDAAKIVDDLPDACFYKRYHPLGSPVSNG